METIGFLSALMLGLRDIWNIGSDIGAGKVILAFMLSSVPS